MERTYPAVDGCSLVFAAKTIGPWTARAMEAKQAVASLMVVEL